MQVADKSRVEKVREGLPNCLRSDQLVIFGFILRCLFGINFSFPLSTLFNLVVALNRISPKINSHLEKKFKTIIDFDNIFVNEQFSFKNFIKIVFQASAETTYIFLEFLFGKTNFTDLGEGF